MSRRPTSTPTSTSHCVPSSAGLTLLAERTAGHTALTDAIASALAPYRTDRGGYRLEVESRYILATPMK